MNTLQDMQQWYRSHCNGDWEHGYGIKIDTLDNPGWSVTIDLTDTELVDRPFSEVRRLDPETDWIHCRVHEGRFEGHGGPFMLEEILRAFSAWATVSQAA